MTSISIVSLGDSSGAPADRIWTSAGLTPSGNPDAVVVVVGDGATAETVATSVANQPAPVLVVLATTQAIDVPAASGASLTTWAPSHELRVRFTTDLPRPAVDEIVTGSPAILTLESPTQSVAAINIALTDHPILTWNAQTRVGILAIAGSGPEWQRAIATITRRWISLATNASAQPDVRVGLLAYGAIGNEHRRAVTAINGLTLTAVCDRNPDRVSDAQASQPSLRGYTDADLLIADPDVDLVVVSTPPDTHAHWALRALDAGKHVVLEKPMAMSAKECDEVMARAAAAGLLAVVYQNRRWDADFLAMRSAIDRGSIGEIFHLEAFVGQYAHPCNYWHSDASVSGGAIFDWGSHFIDQMLMLNPSPVTHVTATEHKRVWLDVTNADHARVTLHHANGAESTFIASDLAAALKPKWYVLGTTGAITVPWRHERLVIRNDIGTVDEHRFAPADSPGDVLWHQTDGSVSTLALPTPESYGFHRELADLLHEGVPMTVQAEQSRDVVAVMEAAAASAADGGRSVVPA